MLVALNICIKRHDRRLTSSITCKPYVFVFLYIRYKKVGISLILLLITACLATTAGISNHYGLTPNRFIRYVRDDIVSNHHLNLAFYIHIYI